MSNRRSFETGGKPLVVLQVTLVARMVLLAIALFTLTGMLVLAKPAGAATSTIPDGDVAALKSAIYAANQNAGPDTVTLAPQGTYTLTQVENDFFGPNGLPSIHSEIIIEGNGAKIIRSLSGQTPDFRLFYVWPGGNLTLRDVELVHGRAVGGDGANSSLKAGAGGGAAGMGGAIFNHAGTLSIEGSALYGNSARGGMGGSYNQGNFLAPQGGGGGGVAGPADLGNGGPGAATAAAGGGCWGWTYYASSVCYWSGIRAPSGGNGGPGGGGGAGHDVGEGGYGGFGGGGGGGGHQGGRGGHGGGYMVGDGGPGGSGDSGFGGGGGGGGNMNPSYGESSGGPGVGGFGGGDGIDGSGGGGGGFGGAIFNHAGTLTITNSTVFSNEVVGGLGGYGAPVGGSPIPGEDGIGLGGGLFNRNGAVTIQSSTFTGNFANTWRPATVTLPYHMPGGTGAGIYHLGDHAPGIKLTMNDTIVANNAGAPPNGGSVNDYELHAINGGAFGEGGSNLIENNGDDGWFSGTVTADPNLGPFQDNGGPTRTSAPGSGSPAIDAAGPDCPPTDGRGVARPHDGDANGSALCDIGAFEVSPPPNDNFSNARTVSGENASVRGFNLAATRESGEPNHFPSPSVGERSVWYSWTASDAGSVTVDTCTSNFDTVLAVYSGGQLRDLSQQVRDDNGCSSGSGSKVTFDARANTTYKIAVATLANSEGVFTLKLAFTDNVPPSAPLISSPANDSYDTDGNDISFSGTAEANSTVRLFEGTTSKGTATAAASGSWSISLSGETEGSHAYTAKATDRAGNTSAASAPKTVTVDKTGPTVVSAKPAHGATNVPATTNAEVAFSEAMDPATVNERTFMLEKLVPNDTGGFDTEPVSATISYDAASRTAILNPEADLEPDAFYHFLVGPLVSGSNMTDLAGNRLGIQSWRFTVADNVAPAAPVITSPANNSYDLDGTIAFSGTAEANSTVKIFEGATLKATAKAGAGGGWSKTLTGVANGRHTYTAKATDRAGNTSAASAPKTVTVDTVKPRVLGTSPPAGATGVSPGANVVATFSEAMNPDTLRSPATFKSTTFKLVRKNPDGTTTPVAAKVGYAVTTTAAGARVYKATLNPDANLQPGKTYVATVTSGAKDVAGNALDQSPAVTGNQPKTWSFKVRT